MNVYDFDGTIFPGDCSIGFCFWCMKRHPKMFFSFFPKAIKNIVMRKTGKIPEYQMQREFFCYLTLVDDFDEQIEKYNYSVVNGTLLAIKRDMEKAVIPDGVVCIASQSCEYGEMTELIIPDTVKTIEFNAFIHCASLKSVTVPASVEVIKQQAFYQCDSLEEICILNPECDICEHWATTISNNGEEFSGVIKGYKGSTAEDYANKFDRTFVPIDSGTGLIIDYGEGIDLPVIPLGDVNFDGNVNAIDASMVLAYYSETSTGKDGGFSPEQISAADIDGNSRVDAVDASYILAYYAYASTTENDIISLEEYMK